MIVWLLAACGAPEGEEAEPLDPTATAFESCDPKEVEGLAAKHGFQLVFEPCGSNMFLDVAWSTDGHRLYYRRGMNHQILDAAAKGRPVEMVPTSIPVGAVAWLSATRLVLPLGPANGGPGPFRIGVYDSDTKGLNYIDLPAEWADPTDLARGSTPHEVLLSAVTGPDDARVRRVFAIDLQSQLTSDPFPWLGPVDTFTYTTAGNAVVAGVGETVTLYDPATGKARGLWSPATRGAMHPSGRWLALEHIGESVSVFRPVGLDELPADERDRALAEAERREAEQPADFPKSVRPPTLSFVDATTGKRYLLDDVQGSQLEWYESQDFYASFVSWGYERKQFRRNVLLGDLARKLLSVDTDALARGVTPVSPPAPSPGP